MSKRLIARSKLSNRQLHRLIDFFALEVPAVKAAHVLHINRQSAERVYQVIRRHLAQDCERRSPLQGEVEADESYFGGHRKGLRGRGAAGKVAVFELLKRRGKGSTRPVPHVTRETLRTVIRQKVPKGSTIDSDQFSGDDGLITEGYRHYRINPTGRGLPPAAAGTSTASRTSGAMPRPNSSGTMASRAVSSCCT